MTYRNGRLQLRCAALDVSSLSERELCVAVATLNSHSLTYGFAGNTFTERNDQLAAVVLLNGQTLTDAGRDLLRQVVGDHLDLLRRQEARDIRHDERFGREAVGERITPRPDLGVTLAGLGVTPPSEAIEGDA